MEDDKKYIVHDPSKGKVYYMTEDEYSARRDRIFQTPGVEVGVRRDIGADDEIDDKGVYYIDDSARGKRYTMTGEEYRARRDKIHANPAASVFTLDVDDYYGEQLADINRQIEEQERRTSTAKAQRNLGFLSPTPGAGAIRPINEKGARDEQRYEEEQRTLDELRKAQWENPRYQEELKALGTAADKGKERVDALSEQIKDTGDYKAWVRYRSSTALVGDSDFADKDKAETELLKTPGYKRDMEALDAANYLYEDAKKELEKPSRYDGNAVLNFLTGVGGNIGKVLTLLSLDKEKRVSLPVMEAVRTIHEHEGEHANIIDLVSDPDKLSYLSDAQKEMLSALVDYTVSSQYRAGNTSLSYNAGAGAIESAGYMLDFVIGGKGAGAATKGLTKGLMRAVAKGAMRAGLKGATRKAALAVPKFAIGTFTSAAKSVLSTPLMPSSYTNFLSQMRQINDAGEVDLSGEALLNAAADVLIENFSEYAGTQVEGLLGLPLKAAGKAGSWLGGNTIGRMIGKTRWEAWADLVSKAKSTSVLKDAAFNGFLGEWGEEWYGNAVRVMTGVDKDALKDFATAEQQLTVLGSFAPMSLFGGVTSGARYRRAQKRMDAAGQALEAALKKANYTQETINNILSVTKAENPAELAQSLAPVIQQVAKDNGNVSEVYKAVCDYAYAVAQYRTLDGVRDADATPLREAMQQDLSIIFGGDNWIMRKAVPLDGEDTQEETELRWVNTLTDKDGNELVVEAQGEDGTVAAVDMEGKRHYVSSGLINIPGKTDAGEAASRQYVLSSLSLRDYLDQRLAARNVNAEALRMREEAAANQQALQQRVASEGVDFGPKEARQHGTLISADANGVQLQVAGQEAPVSMTWEQVAQEMNMPLNPQTDAELEEQELSRIDKMRSLNKSVPEGADLIVPIDGESDPAIYKFIRAELSEGEVIIKAADSEGNEVDLAPEQVSNLGGYLSVAPAETENPAAPQMQDAPADVFDDPVANEIGIDPKYMTKTGDGRRIVNKKALWEGDPEKWAEYNDRNGSGISTIEYVKNKLDKINTTVAAAEAKLKQALLDDAPDDMEQALRSMLSDAQGRQRRIQALYDGYVAAEEQARKAAEAEAKAQRDAEDAKKQAEFQQKIEERKAEQTRREERQQVMLSQDEAFRANTEAFLAAKKYVGRATRLNAGEQSYKAHYVIMEATVPVTSHDPFNGFQPTEGFPVDENGRSLNTRDYQREKEEMDGARRIAEKPDYRLLEYMPGLTAEGVTATGNKRCTARKMAAQMGTDTELVNLYREYAEEYGFTPEQVDEFEHPIIVKVIDESVPYTAKFFDSFNRSIGTAASTVATAAKIGKMTDDALILRVATLLRDFTDIKDAYQSATTMNSLFALLEKEGLVPREDRPRYLDSEGRLTGGGEDFVESLLFGTIFSESDNAIRSAMQDASIRRAVAFAFPTLVRLRSLSGDYSLMPELTDAVRLLVEAKAANDGKREGAVADYMNQFTILAEGLPIEKATVQMLANVLNENKYGSLRRVLDMYINRAEDADSGQSLMTFGDSDGVSSVETKETIVKDILDSLGLNTTVYDNSEQQQPAPADAQIRDASPEQGGSGALFDGAGETSAEPAAAEGSDTSSQEPGIEVTQEIEAARSQVDTNPTEAQKKAGNYRKGHITLDGYDISIENPKGSVRSGTDASGNKWEVTMNNDYGYIRMTEGVDGDHIDVFLSDNPTEGNIFVVDQVNPDNGEFDEHKVMYGFPSEEEARAAYLANYSPGWKGLGNITEVSREEFKKWVESSHRKTKPFAEYKSVKTVAPTKSTVQGLEKYSEEEIKDLVYGHTFDVALEGKERFVLKKITLIGSRTKGTAKEGSDLDVLLEYEGSMKEDDVFNALNGEPLYIDGIRVDINPIRKEQSGTTEDWLKRQKAQQAQEDALAFIGTTREQALLDVLQGELDDISRRMREHPEQRESLLDEKAAVIQNYCEQSQTDPTAKIVSTTLSRLEDAMRNEAFSEDFISKTLSKIAEAINDGAYPRAFRAGGGRLFMLADFLRDAQVVSSTFTHEEEHNITAQKHDDVALAKIGSKEAFLAAIDKWKGRIEHYHRLSDVGVANEFISHALEMYEHATDTQIDKDFKELGINDEKIINFVKNRINERRNRKRQLLSGDRGRGRTDTLQHGSTKEDSGENGRNSEAESGDRLDGQRLRPAAQSQRGAESGRGTAEDRNRYEPSFVRDLSPAERDRLADLDRDGAGNLGIVDDINNEEPEGTALFSLKNGKSLIGLHNISAEQLTKALRLGGLANPSAAVIDINHQDHFAFGDISLIMPSSLVDSRTGRNAGTFTGDAYTPDFPAIKYFKTKESEKRLKELLKGLPKNLADYIYDKVEQYINGDVYHSGLEYIFLKEKGIDLGIQEKQRRYPDASLDEFITQYLKAPADLDYMSFDALMGAYNALSEDERVAANYYVWSYGNKNDINSSIERMEKYPKLRERYTENIGFGRLNNFCYALRSDERNAGGEDMQRTVENAQNYISEQGYSNEFDAWLGKTIDELGYEGKIFSHWTYDGTKVYKKATLENISAKMRKEGLQNSDGTGGTNATKAMLLKRLRTLDDIRKNSYRLDSNAEEQYEAAQQQWSDVIEMLSRMQKIDDNPFSNFSYAEARLQEAILKRDPIAYLNREYKYNLAKDGEFEKSLNEAVDALRNLPSKYFETKFERPVYFGEFAAAVVPSGLESGIKDELKEQGLKLFEYDSKDKDSRREATRAAAEDDGILFSLANINQNIFVSNAARAVEGIKMEKATPEQWLKMIEKEGGLKAGEDKWMGLSDWLKESDNKTLTKEEVLDFINENKITIEETRYSENGDEMAIEKAHPGFSRAFYLDEDDFRGEVTFGGINDLDAAIELYNNEHEDKIVVDDSEETRMYDPGRKISNADYDRLLDFGESLVSKGNAGFGMINSTRLDYTTGGLENKREIALTVPTIEPYNENDKVHFGDAGEGRAVAWVRFGETRTEKGKGEAPIEVKYKGAEPADEPHKKAIEGILLNWNDSESVMRNERKEDQFDVARSMFENALRDNYYEGTDEQRTLRAQILAILGEIRKEDFEPIYEQGGRVLVIDEIQSKRHQDAREDGGYKNLEKLEEAKERVKQMFRYYGVRNIMQLEEAITDEQHYKDLNEYKKLSKAVPAAPFEKNWHELAFKRMLRLAAEEGYDYVAWTTGEQQAERYDLSKRVDAIDYIKNEDGTYQLRAVIGGRSNILDESLATPEDKLADYVGKEIAQKIVNGEGGMMNPNLPDKRLTGVDLRVGGEGMKGFYDDMLPRFANKYGKKWGVKVEDIELPDIYDEIGHPLVVHSIPVTDQMKADVMDGQPMFSMVRGEESDNNVSALERLEGNDNFREAQQGANKVPGANNPTDAELDEVMFSLKVYHGSAAVFEKFDHSHMGEGEGAQAFGWGTYVSEISAVAKGYADAAARRKRASRPAHYDPNYDYYWKGQLIDIETINPLQMAKDVLDDQGTIAKASAKAERFLNMTREENPEMSQKWQETLDILRQSTKADFTKKKVVFEGDRMLYKVSIPADSGENYLGWREPVSDEQLSLIYPEFQKQMYPNVDAFSFGYIKNSGIASSGEELYRWLTNQLGSTEGASKLLHAAGFTGIKYKADAGNSRKNNYVIFDENDAEVEDSLAFSLSRNNRSTIQGWLDKRSDLSDETKAQLMDYLDELDNSKLQLATARWFTKGTIRIPEDMPKVEQAVSVSEKAKVDPLQYDSPMALLEAHADFKPAEKRINPDEVSTLHKAKEFPEHGITVYDVDDTQESRENMRQIINTHYGKEASPWCLLQGDGNGNLTEQSERYWKHYNAYPKQVAFKDGKLLAFSANDSSEKVWWDRQDEPWEGIPLGVLPVKGDELGRSIMYVIGNEGRLPRPAKDGVLCKGNRQNGEYMEWDNDGNLSSIEHYKNGKRDGLFEDYENGNLERRAHFKDDYADGLYEFFYKDGSLRSRTEWKEGSANGIRESFRPDGTREFVQHYLNGLLDGVQEMYFGDGSLMEHWEYSAGAKHGIHEQYSGGRLVIRENYHEGKKDGELIRWDSVGNIRVRENYRLGKLDGVQEYYDFGEGRLSLRLTYKNGECVKDEGFGIDGHLVELKTYDENGEKHGIEKEWDKYGNITTMIQYEHGEFVRNLLIEGATEDTPLFSLVTDKAELERLESEPTIILYRAMQKVGPGEYIPPKSQKIPNSPEEKGKRLKAREPQKDGLWYRSDENPELAYEKDGKYYFDLKTANKNLGDVNGVLYNPYFHLSSWPLNDQFSAAYKSEGFVVVACEVPISELSGKYKAEKANDSTGPKDWGSGPVTAQLGDGRQVVLSRYVKIIREVSDREVADIIAPKIKEKDITVPANVVTPGLRKALEAQGVKISEPINDEFMFSLSRSREDIISGAETEGWKGVMDKDDAQALRKEVFELLPLSAKEAVVDAALGSDFNLRASLNNYLMRLAEGGLENDETGMLRHLYNSIRDLSGNESLTDADCRYIVWKEGQGAVGDDLMALATQQAFKNRFGVGRDTQEQQFSMAKDFSEATDESREKADSAVEEASENLKMAREAAKASAKGGDLKAIVKAMTAQKTYDKATVASVVRFAKEILKGGKVKSLSRREIGRLLGLIANSTGKAPSYVAKYTDQLTDQLLDIIVSDEKEAFAEMLSIRDKVVNKQGVEAQGALDILGQTTLKAMKAFMTKSKADIQTRREELSDLLDSKDDAVRQRALAEMDGLDLAEQYIDTVGASESEAYGLEDDLDAYKDAKKMGAIDKKTHDQFVKSVRDALRENKLERVDDYRAMRVALKEMMKRSTDKTAAFREGEKQHADEIRHDASRDLEGESAKVMRKETRLSRLVNNKTVRFFLKPLATFDQMLRTFAKHNITGEGYLYNRFMSGFLKAREEYITNRDSGYAELDAKASEVFGRKMKWTDLYRLGKRLPALTVRMWDGSQMSDVPLPQPNLLYIYMANKMTDGKMKLRRAGISEEDVEAIKNFLEPRLVTLGDWLQDEFLPARRNRYNAVYESLFGAPMPAIENYFPLKIAEGDRQVEVDVADGDVNNPLSSVITGSIIKRVRNSRMLDVANANVFDVAIEHLESMEDWAAYAHFRKDLNTLLSYRHFRNQVKNMSTVFGSGEQLWKNFIDVCKIAAGKYKSKGEHTQLLNVSKGATRARINFRPYTALKQLLSYPAFWVDASVDELWDGIHHPLVSWRWCMENLPLFRQRWEKRTIGDTRLMKTDSDWKVWEANLVKQASKSGMLPNALVDAFTIAIGAKAVYETKYKKYVSEGMSEEMAAEKARQDATVVYNQSQQSDENAFISALQLDRTLEAAALTTFRNASMGYQRRVHGAYRTLGRLLRGKGREDYIDSAEKQYISEGMSQEAARTRAEREYRKAGIKAAGEIFIYQFFLNYLWKLGPLGALYAIIFGGDDDKKKKKLSDPALATAITGFFEGLSMGGTVTDLVTNLVSGNKVRDWNFLGLPILQDIKNITASLASRGIDSQSIYDLVGLLAQGWCGVDPRLLSDTLVAVVDAAEGDMGLAKEIGFLLMRVAQAPQSQIKDFYMDEIQATAEEAGEMSAAELALRYVKYRRLRRDPLSAFREEDEKEQRKDYSETEKLVKEAMGMDK